MIAINTGRKQWSNVATATEAGRPKSRVSKILSDQKFLRKDCESPAFGMIPGLCTPKARLRGF